MYINKIKMTVKHNITSAYKLDKNMYVKQLNCDNISINQNINRQLNL